MKRKFIGLLALFIACCSQAQTVYEPKWSSLDKRPVPDWFTHDKFGIFIHWGLYSVPAWAPKGAEYDTYSKYAEWYWQRLISDTTKVGRAFRNFHQKTYGANFRYPDFAPLFTAELFNPNQWAEVFKSSGARYVVLTSKHHDGFALWPSAKAWNWNAVDVGPHRDLVGDLTKAVKEKGLRMGLYYSLYEWYNPLYKKDVNKYVDDHMLPQLKDLVTNYEPEVVWTDGAWDHPSPTWKSEQFLAWLYNESPVKNTVVVNDRWGKETKGKHGDFYTTEYNHGKENITDHPWEESRGIGGSYGYSRAENLADYNSSSELIHLLIEKVAGGGNLLLDVGPTADGRIPVIMQQRLKDIGDWLSVNGEAIYGTHKWKGAPLQDNNNTVFYTAKDNAVYVLVTKWPEGPLQVRGVNAKNVQLLGTNVAVRNSTRGGLTIFPPLLSPSQNPSAHAWVFKIITGERQ